LPSRRCSFSPFLHPALSFRSRSTFLARRRSALFSRRAFEKRRRGPRAIAPRRASDRRADFFSLFSYVTHKTPEEEEEEEEEDRRERYFPNRSSVRTRADVTAARVRSKARASDRELRESREPGFFERQVVQINGKYLTPPPLKKYSAMLLSCVFSLGNDPPAGEGEGAGGSGAPFRRGVAWMIMKQSTRVIYGVT